MRGMANGKNSVATLLCLKRARLQIMICRMKRFPRTMDPILIQFIANAWM